MHDLRLMIALARAKQRYPAMRLTQIICNAVGKTDPFYVSDVALTEALERYCAIVDRPRQRRSGDPK